MTVELEPLSGGRWHFAIGPVEKWVLGLASLALVGGVGLLVSVVLARLEAVTEAQNKQSTELALANQQLRSMTTLLVDVPALRTQVAEMKVRVDRHDEDIRELRQMRGLK